MIVPWQEIPGETLESLIEAFVLREGTDYGLHEVSLADKVLQIKEQLKQGTVVIVYSELHESVDIVARDKFTRNN
jgi:uncharacterized protein YheU (UPF0270 family)